MKKKEKIGKLKKKVILKKKKRKKKEKKRKVRRKKKTIDYCCILPCFVWGNHLEYVVM